MKNWKHHKLKYLNILIIKILVLLIFLAMISIIGPKSFVPPFIFIIIVIMIISIKEWILLQSISSNIIIYNVNLDDLNSDKEKDKNISFVKLINKKHQEGEHLSWCFSAKEARDFFMENKRLSKKIDELYVPSIKGGRLVFLSQKSFIPNTKLIRYYELTELGKKFNITLKC